MKLANNPEAARLLRSLALVAAGSWLLALLFFFISMQSFSQLAHLGYAQIVGGIIREHPALEQDIIRQIQQIDVEAAEEGGRILSRYGLNASDLVTHGAVMAQSLRLNLVLYLTLPLVICGALALIMVGYLSHHYRQLGSLTSYAKQIKAGDYSLDIRDNAEGELSLLKNEVYKITSTLREESEALSRDKKALADSIADISHQLKTPMTSMFVLTDLLTQEPSGEMKTEFLDRMKAQLERTEWLVASLLKLARLDAGVVTMRREEVLVSQVVARAMEWLQVPLDIKLQEVRVRGDQEARFTGDVNWTVEAVVNILSNCIEHTPEKGLIEISCRENPIYTELILADTGAGIDAQDLPFIFNRFYKGTNAGDDSVGIGLAMARTIIEEQGGDVGVESQPGQGTRFTIKFYKI